LKSFLTNITREAMDPLVLNTVRVRVKVRENVRVRVRVGFRVNGRASVRANLKVLVRSRARVRFRVRVREIFPYKYYKRGYGPFGAEYGKI
jgi:hypothetical protein